MKRFLLPVLLFLAFISESTFVELFPTERFEIDRTFVPRFMMVLIMLTSFFYDRNKAIINAIIFGLLFDIIYTDIIGIYMFSLPIVVYILSYSMKVLHTNLLVVFFVVIIGIALLEIIIYGLYFLVNVVELDWYSFMNNRLFPTLVLNGVFLIIIYYPMRNFLLGLQGMSNKENDKLV